MKLAQTLITICLIQVSLGCDVAPSLQAQDKSTTPTVTITPTPDKPAPLTVDETEMVFDRLISLETYVATRCMWKSKEGESVVNVACLSEVMKCAVEVDPIDGGAIKAMESVRRCATQWFGKQEIK